MVEWNSGSELARWLPVGRYVIFIRRNKILEFNLHTLTTSITALEMYIKNDMKAKMRFLYDLEADVGTFLTIFEIF